MMQTKPFEPAPERLPFVFVKFGWRGVERYFGARSERNLRWLNECGRERLDALRRRYMRGDLAALEEVKANALSLHGQPIANIPKGERLNVGRTIAHDA